MIKSVNNTDLKAGDVLALPMGRNATIETVDVGTRFVSIKTEFGKTRLGRYDQSLIEVPEPKVLCYSDHNEDIRTKGDCDYCGGTERQ